MFTLEKQKELEKIFSKIKFDSKIKAFLNTSNFEKKLQEYGFIIKYSSIDLIYFDDIDKPYQDYSGVEYTLKIETKNFNEYFFNVKYFNGSSLDCEKKIYYKKPKEFEDYSEKDEIEELSFSEFFEENIS